MGALGLARALFGLLKCGILVPQSIRRYPDRVHLLLGNRDINKMRRGLSSKTWLAGERDSVHCEDTPLNLRMKRPVACWDMSWSPGFMACDSGQLAEMSSCKLIRCEKSHLIHLVHTGFRRTSE